MIAAEVLANRLLAEADFLTCCAILRACPMAIRSKSRKPETVKIRQVIAFWLTRKLGHGYKTTGRVMHRHHTTILYSAELVRHTKYYDREIIQLGRQWREEE